jgi:hypothetical protein
MPVKKGFVNEFVWVKFHEHPIVDYRKQSAEIFDVTSEGYSNFPSDFITDGDFDHGQYCICLMETAFGLQADQLSSFLDHQCALLKVPYRWLIQFDTLLNNNCNHTIIKPFHGKLNFLIQLLEDKRNHHAGYVRERQLIFKSVIHNENDERFDIVKIKEEVSAKSTFNAKKFFLLRRRTDYLQEVEKDENAPFVKSIDMELNFLEATLELQDGGNEYKKIVFKGTPSQLADLIWQIKGIRNKEEDLIFEGSTSSYARFISSSFCQSDGSPFMEDSIRKFLTRYNSGKEPSKKNQMDISKIQLKEN